MPRYFFDFSANGLASPDETGTQYDLLDDVRGAVCATLPVIAKEENRVGEQSYTASVRDEQGNVVYSATLTVTDTWKHSIEVPASALLRRPLLGHSHVVDGSACVDPDASTIVVERAKALQVENERIKAQARAEIERARRIRQELAILYSWAAGRLDQTPTSVL